MVRTNLRIWHWRLLDTTGRDWKNWGITLGETRGDYGKTRQTHFLWGQSAHSLARSCNSCYIVVFLPFNMLGWCMDMRKYRDQYRIRTPNQESATKSIRNRQQYITVHGLWKMKEHGNLAKNMRKQGGVHRREGEKIGCRCCTWGSSR